MFLVFLVYISETHHLQTMGLLPQSFRSHGGGIKQCTKNSDIEDLQIEEPHGAVACKQLLKAAGFQGSKQRGPRELSNEKNPGDYTTQLYRDKYRDYS